MCPGFVRSANKPLPTLEMLQLLPSALAGRLVRLTRWTLDATTKRHFTWLPVCHGSKGCELHQIIFPLCRQTQCGFWDCGHRQIARLPTRHPGTLLLTNVLAAPSGNKTELSTCNPLSTHRDITGTKNETNCIFQDMSHSHCCKPRTSSLVQRYQQYFPLLQLFPSKSWLLGKLELSVGTHTSQCLLFFKHYSHNVHWKSS